MKTPDATQPLSLTEAIIPVASLIVLVALSYFLFGDAGAAFFQAQGAEIGDVNEPVLFAFANVDEGGVDAGEHIFDGAEVDVADLVAALGHHQLIDTLVGEHCGDAQLLGDDDLLGHGESLFGSVSPASGGRRNGRGERRWTGPMAGQDLSGGSTRRAGIPVDGNYSGSTPCSDRGRRLRKTGRPSIPSGDRGYQDPTRTVSDWAERESPGPGSMQG